MKTLYVRIDEETSKRVENLMKTLNCSSQKAGEYILKSFFSAQEKKKTNMEKARDAVEVAKLECENSNSQGANINTSLINVMESILDANGG